MSTERLDDAVRRTLRVKYRGGLFSGPVPQEPPLDAIYSQKHRALAREAVQKSLVLLKNEGALPLRVQDYARLVVAGEAADN